MRWRSRHGFAAVVLAVVALSLAQLARLGARLSSETALQEAVPMSDTMVEPPATTTTTPGCPHHALDRLPNNATLVTAFVRNLGFAGKRQTSKRGNQKYIEWA